MKFLRPSILEDRRYCQKDCSTHMTGQTADSDDPDSRSKDERSRDMTTWLLVRALASGTRATHRDEDCNRDGMDAPNRK